MVIRSVGFQRLAFELTNDPLFICLWLYLALCKDEIWSDGQKLAAWLCLLVVGLKKNACMR